MTWIYRSSSGLTTRGACRGGALRMAPGVRAEEVSRDGRFSGVLFPGGVWPRRGSLPALRRGPTVSPSGGVKEINRDLRPTWITPTTAPGGGQELMARLEQGSPRVQAVGGEVPTLRAAQYGCRARRCLGFLGVSSCRCPNANGPLGPALHQATEPGVEAARPVV